MTGYLDRIQDAINAGNLPAKPGQVTHVHVDHGKGCKAPAEPCTCTPRITAVVHGQVLTIGQGGSIIERSKRQ